MRDLVNFHFSRLAARLLAICLFLGMVFGMTGCEFAQPPTATVVSTILVEQTDEAGLVDITIAVTNENDFPLELKVGNYALSVADGEQFSFETYVPYVSLPPNGSQDLVLQAAVPHNGQGLNGQAYRVSGSMQWVPPGEIRQLLTESGVPLPAFTFADRGNLN